MVIVLDANLIAALVLQLAYSRVVKAKMVEWTEAEVRFAAPALWSYEVGSALRKAIAAGFVPEGDKNSLIEQTWDLEIETVPDSPDLQRRALVWADKLGQSKAYDGAYLAVAEALGAEFWTANRELARRAGADWVRAILA